MFLEVTREKLVGRGAFCLLSLRPPSPHPILNRVHSISNQFHRDSIDVLTVSKVLVNGAPGALQSMPRNIYLKNVIQARFCSIS